ncbi:MAG: hypothetical protein R3B13_15160 [Polyangiaceae bacterium]
MAAKPLARCGKLPAAAMVAKPPTRCGKLPVAALAAKPHARCGKLPVAAMAAKPHARYGVDVFMRIPIALALCAVCCAPAQQAPVQSASEPTSEQTVDLARKQNAQPLHRAEPLDAPSVESAESTEPPLVSEVSDAQIGVAAETPAPGLSGSAPRVHHEPADEDVRIAVADADALKLRAAEARLRKALRRIDAKANIEDRMLAHAILGRAYVARRAFKQARAEYDRVLADWTDPDARVKEMLGGEPSNAARVGRVQQALDAAGEALFQRAEEKRRAAVALRAPFFPGPDTDDAVQRFITTKAKVWIDKRRKLIEDAQKEYHKVVELRPTPPPSWVVASAAQTAEMLYAFLAELKKTPIPPRIRKDPKLRQVYEDSMNDAFGPTKSAADTVNAMCIQFARRFQLDTPHSRDCEARAKP